MGWILYIISKTKAVNNGESKGIVFLREFVQSCGEFTG
jgi:hypothetical protein